MLFSPHASAHPWCQSTAFSLGRVLMRRHCWEAEFPSQPLAHTWPVDGAWHQAGSWVACEADAWWDTHSLGEEGEFGVVVVESIEKEPGAQCEGHRLLLPGGHWTQFPSRFPASQQVASSSLQFPLLSLWLHLNFTNWSSKSGGTFPGFQAVLLGSMPWATGSQAGHFLPRMLGSHDSWKMEGKARVGISPPFQLLITAQDSLALSHFTWKERVIYRVPSMADSRKLKCVSLQTEELWRAPKFMGMCSMPALYNCKGSLGSVELTLCKQIYATFRAVYFASQKGEELWEWDLWRPRCIEEKQRPHPSTLPWLLSSSIQLLPMGITLSSALK